MDVYVYQSAFLCEDCAMKVSADRAPSDDSDQYPVGPYPDGGGEADCPHHCDHCGLFLRNPLTGDGERYIQAQIAQSPLTYTTRAWLDFYRPVID